MDNTKYFCLFGQVDTGKSTLAGRIIHQCSPMTDHNFEKHCKSCKGSEYALWSRFLDIYEEERERSKTFEFTTVDLKYDDTNYVLIDTPGHKAFIRSLIQAMSSYNNIIGCVLVSARTGEFDSGWSQTTEDIILAKSIGIDQIIILVNKMDTVDWDENIYQTIKTKTTKLLKICKFSTITFVPISGYNNLNLFKVDHDFGNTKCFMDILSTITINKQTPEQLSTDKWTEFIASIKIIDLQDSIIISPGFKCIAHHDAGEYTINIDKIKGKSFIRKGDTAIVKFTSSAEMTGNNTRIILRLMEKTLGFGKITKVF